MDYITYITDYLSFITKAYVVVYAWLLVVNVAITLSNLSLFIISLYAKVFFLGFILVILWLFIEGENLFKDKTFRKIIKNISYVYIIITLLAAFPYIIKLYPEAILITLLSCALGYISIIMYAIIGYSLYKIIKNSL
ncbi:MAG: hypothetical protein ACO2ON_00970 [Candidatus Nanopusillus sp.]